MIDLHSPIRRSLVRLAELSGWLTFVDAKLVRDYLSFARIGSAAPHKRHAGLDRFRSFIRRMFMGWQSTAALPEIKSARSRMEKELCDAQAQLRYLTLENTELTKSVLRSEIALTEEEALAKFLTTRLTAVVKRMQEATKSGRDRAGRD